MHIRNKMKFVIVAIGVAAGQAWGGGIALNEAVSSFEYTDLANTIVPTSQLALTNSEAWTVDFQSPTGFARFDTGDGTDGNFYITLNAKGASDYIKITSVDLGISMVEGSTYKVSIDSKETLTGDKDYQFEVYRASDDAVIVSNTFIAGAAAWVTDTLEFIATAPDAGQDIYLVITRDSALNGNAKSVKLDNIILEELGAAFSDSLRVLAFNVDDNKADFEYVASNVGFDLSLTASLDGASSGGSTDESYGTFYDPTGAGAGAPAAYPWRAQGDSALVADITITNNSSDLLKLDGLYFDLSRLSATSVRQIELDYTGGNLGTSGNVYSVTLDSGDGTTGFVNFDWTLGSEGKTPGVAAVTFNALSDRTLGVGETASFRLTVDTSTDAATEPDQALLDNIALIGDFITDGILVDWKSPDMFFGAATTTLLKLGANNAVTNGDLYIQNYNPTSPLFDRKREGYYQKQDIYGIMQTGNQGATAEVRPFRYYKFTEATPSEGNFLLTVTPAGDVTNGTSILQSSLIHYNAEDFYDSLEVGETITSLEMNLIELDADDAAVRFAVKNDGQWYVSFTKATTAGSFSLPVPTAEAAWGALTPSSSGSASLMTADGIVYDTSGASFTNVEAVGFFMEGSGGVAENKVRFKYDSFTALAGPVPTDFPDPSVLAYNVDDVREDFEYVKSGIDFSLTIVSAGNSPSSTQGSLDGSLGSFFDPNSADTNSAARPWAGRGSAPFVAEMTIGNGKPDSILDLSGFHFDLYRHQVASISVRRYELEYIGGDLSGVSSGLVYGVTVNSDEFARYFVTNIVEGVTNVTEITPYGDFDWTFAAEGTTPSAGTKTFNAMADTSLDFGESATFRLTIKSSTDAATEANQARLDNIAFIGTLQGVGFGNWINGFGLALDDRDPDDDPDGDGLTNLEEYGRDGNPNDINDTGTASFIEVAGGVFNYVHPQRTDDDTLNYYLELNDDLVFGEWTNTGYVVTGTNITAATLDYVTNEVSTASKDEQFIRLIIEQL
ncbi:hypothetical protein P4B35_11360 [Pontiellaceae bacterium B12227]|nr:hypothetical protein [Pontiellaceae bacterium B12227]